MEPTEKELKEAADRKLLESVAKFAGYKVQWHDNLNCFFYTEQPYRASLARMVWLPLDDDGDSARLATRCGLTIHHYLVSKQVGICPPGKADDIAREAYGSDPDAAVRRAVAIAVGAMANAEMAKTISNQGSNGRDPTADR